MLYQTNRYSAKIPALINLQMLLALGGGLLAAAQALLIVLEGNILCLNEGCEIVEKMTTVPPIAFNVAGGLFFMTVFLALWQGVRGVKGWLNLARVLLLAGMAAEGVLIGFQYFVAEVFCSYCLIIFAIICVLNLLMGWRQLLASLAVAGAVLLAFASLKFVPHSQVEGMVLEKGVYGSLTGSQPDKTLHLFFSSTCPHCEDVIATLDEQMTCSLNFNPVDELKVSPLLSLALTGEYSAELNRRFLKNVGVAEIPVLVVKTAEEVRILKGKLAILGYLDSNCRADASGADLQTGFSDMNGQSPVVPFLVPPGSDDACAVDTDCEETPGRSGGK